LRQGVASNASFPRVPGIEAVGIVVAAPAGEFALGTKVATMMGGMGREFDGGYAEFVSAPAGQVIPFESSLDWATLGAVPEMLQTAYGSLSVGLDLTAGQWLLIRGGTSSVGMAATALAKQRGAAVIATTRNPAKDRALRENGADYALIDNGAVAAEVRLIKPEGVDGAIELVGTNTLADTLRATRVKGVVCFTGMLSDIWTIRDFYPMNYIPNGVRLTAYSGQAADLPKDVLQEYLDSVAAGAIRVPIAHVYGFDEIVDAHRTMEASTEVGKLVVRL